MPNSDRLNILQVLRAIAACSVVAAHALSQASQTWPSIAPEPSTLATTGHSGVDLFFVLSGFLMVYLHRDQFGRDDAARRFFLRRLNRIVPLYWVLTTVALALFFVAPSLFSAHHHAEPAWILGMYLFVPWPQADASFMPILGVGWTLSYEMLFYALFALGLLFRRGLPIILLVILSAVLVGLIVQPGHPALRVLSGVMMLEFLFGAVAALLVRAYALPHWGSAALIAAGIAIIGSTAFWIPGEIARVFAWGFPAMLIVAGCAWLRPACDGKAGRVLVMLGDASYAIYLVQVFALPAIAIVLRVSGAEGLGIGALTVLLTVGGTLAGVAVWALVERPLLIAMQRRFGRRKETQPAEGGGIEGRLPT